MHAQGAKARLFFGLPVGEPARDALARLARDIAARAHGRAVPADNLHATLAFLGSVHRARLPVLEAIGAGAGGARTVVTLDRLGSYRRAGVAWVGAAQVPGVLTDVQARLAAALAADGFGLEERAWQLHVTLARRCTVALSRADMQPLACVVDRVALYESVSGAEGPRYVPLATWPLAALP